MRADARAARDEWIRRNVGRMPYREIAAAVSMSRRSVERIARVGLPPEPPRRPESQTREQARELAKQGLGRRQIAEALGVGPDHIRRLLKA